MKEILSFLIITAIKAYSHIFYRFKVELSPKSFKEWEEVKLIIFLNHTSLFEPLFLGVLPWRFIFKLPKKLLAPGASKTLNRPIVGKFWKILSPGMISISRQRDKTWREFMQKIHEGAIVAIAPEGRMKRKNGLDINGNKMTVKSGVADIIEMMNEGKILFAYSGGLHHVQAPGEFPKLFKILKMNLEIMDIRDYKKQFTSEGIDWKREVTSDLQNRLETKCP